MLQVVAWGALSTRLVVQHHCNNRLRINRHSDFRRKPGPLWYFAIDLGNISGFLLSPEDDTGLAVSISKQLHH